ncbi:MAG: hypothetical protein AAFZ11_03870 [Pseudomonadota bacterium]
MAKVMSPSFRHRAVEKLRPLLSPPGGLVTQAFSLSDSMQCNDLAPAIAEGYGKVNTIG